MKRLALLAILASSAPAAASPEKLVRLTGCKPGVIMASLSQSGGNESDSATSAPPEPYQTRQSRRDRPRDQQRPRQSRPCAYLASA
jgi:hypothetical protein